MINKLTSFRRRLVLIVIVDVTIDKCKQRDGIQCECADAEIEKQRPAMNNAPTYTNQSIVIL